MIYESLRDFRAQTKAAFDLAATTPVYINRDGSIYMLKFLAPAEETDIAIDPATNEKILIMKKES